jgi:hypothetical protein
VLTGLVAAPLRAKHQFWAMEYVNVILEDMFQHYRHGNALTNNFNPKWGY